jgi:hypothetical protein
MISKKVLVLAIVPVLVVMSGALAFSAFTGTISTTVDSSAGYLLWEQGVSSSYIYEQNTPVTTLSDVSVGATNITMASSVTITISDNFAPGNWAVYNITVTNNGSVGFVLGVGTIVTAGPNGLLGLTNSSVPYGTFVFGSALTGTGFEYAVSLADGFGSSISPGHSTTYSVYVGLGGSSGNSYEESTFSVTFPITVTSDP